MKDIVIRRIKTDGTRIAWGPSHTGMAFGVFFIMGWPILYSILDSFGLHLPILVFWTLLIAIPILLSSLFWRQVKITPNLFQVSNIFLGFRLDTIEAPSHSITFINQLYPKSPSNDGLTLEITEDFWDKSYLGLWIEVRHGTNTTDLGGRWSTPKWSSFIIESLVAIHPTGFTKAQLGSGFGEQKK